MVDSTCRQYANVILGDDAIVGEFVLLGVPPRDFEDGEMETCIDSGAMIRSHTVIYAGNRIGRGFQTGHGVMIRENNVIGHNVSIGAHSIVEHNVRIGNNVRIHGNAFVPEYSVVEDGAWIGPNVVLTNATYPASPNAKANLKGPHILQKAKIGANATILPGVTIGKNALVGAGSVVTRNVPDGKVVVGNPARIIGDISDIPEYEIALDNLESKKES